jgi:ABC-type transporter Mla MlaB component
MATSRARSVAFAIRGPIARADLPGLCERVCRLLGECEAEVVLCDVADVSPDAVTVDALARLELAARRRGCRVALCHASDELLDLVAFMGLEEVCRHEKRAMTSGTPERLQTEPDTAEEDPWGA